MEYINSRRYPSCVFYRITVEPYHGENTLICVVTLICVLYRITVEPYHGEITSIDVNPYHRVATPTVAVDRLDNFGSYVAAEIRAMAADKRNEAIASVFEVIKRSWTSSWSPRLTSECLRVLRSTRPREVFDMISCSRNFTL